VERIIREIETEEKKRGKRGEKIKKKNSRELDATALLTAVLRLSLFSNEYAMTH